VAALAVSAQPARGDVGIVKISPSEGVAGDEVQVTVGCGFCFPPCSESPRATDGTCMPSRHARPPGKYSFPIELVPIGHSLAPHRCGADALCAPTSVGRPRGWPFIYLGRAMPAFGRGDLERRGALPRYRLGFRIPAVEPGLYQFVIYSGREGQRGALIADAPRWRLRVRPPDPASARGGGSETSAWIGGAAVAVVGALIALWLLRRRAASGDRAVRARSTSR
jgi:hypothetical protein